MQHPPKLTRAGEPAQPARPFNWRAYFAFKKFQVVPNGAFFQQEPLHKNRFTQGNLILVLSPETYDSRHLAIVVETNNCWIKYKIEGEGKNSERTYWVQSDDDRIAPIVDGPPHWGATQPKNFKNLNFKSWIGKYIKKASSKIAPVSFFKPLDESLKPVHNLFRVGHKLLAYDKDDFRGCLFPATVKSVRGDFIKVIFDNSPCEFEVLLKYCSRELYSYEYAEKYRIPFVSPQAELDTISKGLGTFKSVNSHSLLRTGNQGNSADESEQTTSHKHKPSVPLGNKKVKLPSCSAEENAITNARVIAILDGASAEILRQESNSQRKRQRMERKPSVEILCSILSTGGNEANIELPQPLLQDHVDPPQSTKEAHQTLRSSRFHPDLPQPSTSTEATQPSTSKVAKNLQQRPELRADPPQLANEAQLQRPTHNSTQPSTFKVATSGAQSYQSRVEPTEIQARRSTRKRNAEPNYEGLDQEEDDRDEYVADEINVAAANIPRSIIRTADQGPLRSILKKQKATPQSESLTTETIFLPKRSSPLVTTPQKILPRLTQVHNQPQLLVPSNSSMWPNNRNSVSHQLFLLPYQGQVLNQPTQLMTTHLLPVQPQFVIATPSATSAIAHPVLICSPQQNNFMVQQTAAQQKRKLAYRPVKVAEFEQIVRITDETNRSTRHESVKDRDLLRHDQSCNEVQVVEAVPAQTHGIYPVTKRPKRYADAPILEEYPKTSEILQNEPSRKAFKKADSNLPCSSGSVQANNVIAELPSTRQDYDDSSVDEVISLSDEEVPCKPILNEARPNKAKKNYLVLSLTAHAAPSSSNSASTDLASLNRVEETTPDLPAAIIRGCHIANINEEIPCEPIVPNLNEVRQNAQFSTNSTPTDLATLQVEETTPDLLIANKKRESSKRKWSRKSKRSKRNVDSSSDSDLDLYEYIRLTDQIPAPSPMTTFEGDLVVKRMYKPKAKPKKVEVTAADAATVNIEVAPPSPVSSIEQMQSPISASPLPALIPTNFNLPLTMFNGSSLSNAIASESISGITEVQPKAVKKPQNEERIEPRPQANEVQIPRQPFQNPPSQQIDYLQSSASQSRKRSISHLSLEIQNQQSSTIKKAKPIRQEPRPHADPPQSTNVVELPQSLLQDLVDPPQSTKEAHQTRRSSRFHPDLPQPSTSTEATQPSTSKVTKNSQQRPELRADPPQTTSKICFTRIHPDSTLPSTSKVAKTSKKPQLQDPALIPTNFNLSLTMFNGSSLSNKNSNEPIEFQPKVVEKPQNEERIEPEVKPNIEKEAEQGTTSIEEELEQVTMSIEKSNRGDIEVIEKEIPVIVIEEEAIDDLQQKKKPKKEEPSECNHQNRIEIIELDDEDVKYEPGALSDDEADFEEETNPVVAIKQLKGNKYQILLSVEGNKALQFDKTMLANSNQYERTRSREEAKSWETWDPHEIPPTVTTRCSNLPKVKTYWQVTLKRKDGDSPGNQIPCLEEGIRCKTFDTEWYTTSIKKLINLLADKEHQENDGEIYEASERLPGASDGFVMKLKKPNKKPHVPKKFFYTNPTNSPVVGLLIIKDILYLSGFCPNLITLEPITCCKNREKCTEMPRKFIPRHGELSRLRRENINFPSYEEIAKVYDIRLGKWYGDIIRIHGLGFCEIRKFSIKTLLQVLEICDRDAKGMTMVAQEIRRAVRRLY